MSEQTLFTREDAARIERQAQDLVGAWPTISVLPNQISVAAECISPYAQKISDRLILMLTAGLAALIGYLAWKTAFFDPYVALAYPYVAARAETATEAMVYAYAVPIVILMLFGLAAIGCMYYGRFGLTRTLHVAFMPEAISVQRRFKGFDRYPSSTRMSFEMRPHERAKDEESWEQRELRQSKTSWTGRYYRKAFHIVLRLGDYRRVDLADVYGERKAEALHNALNFAVDVIQRLPRRTKSSPQSGADGRASSAAYGERPDV